VVRRGFLFVGKETSVAKRKFLVAIGQSNSAPFADAQSWEDENLQIALRNPQVNAIQHAEGSYSDVLNLPYTFSGGRQSGVLGDGPKGRPWQVANTKGKAVQAVRMLTFYDPLPAQTNIVKSTNFKYPGICTVAAGSTADKLVTSLEWQYNPRNIVLTRKRDGRQHTITSTALGTTVYVSPLMAPPPEAGEEFIYPFTGGAVGTTSTVVLANTLGGVNDAGTYDVKVPGLSYSGKDSNASAPGIVSIHLASQPMTDSDVVVLSPAFDNNGQTASLVTTTNGSADIVLTVNLVAFSLLQVGEWIRFDGVINSAVTLDGRYIVTYADAATGVIRIAATRGGANITMGTGGNPAAEIIAPSLPHGLPIVNLVGTPQQTPEYTVESVVTAEVTATPSNANQGSNALVFGLAHGIEVNQRVRISADLGPYLSNVDYWVHPNTTSQNLALSSTPGPTYTLVTVPVTTQATGQTVTTVGTLGSVILRKPATNTVAALLHTPNHQFRLDGQHLYSNVYPATVLVTAGPGGSLPNNLSSTTPFIVNVVSTSNGQQVVDLRDSAGVLVTWQNNGTAPLVFTQIGGDTTLRCFDLPHRISIERRPTYRGTLTGLTITCTSGANAGQTRPCGDIYLNSSGKSVVEVGQPFTNATEASATYTIQPPSWAGQQIPFSKFAMWLPWSPFEGEAYHNIPTSTQINCAGPGSPITFTFLTDFLAKNTQIEFYGDGPSVGNTNAATAGSTSSVINCSSLGVGVNYAGRYVRFRSGALKGQVRLIASNTTTAITMAQAFSAAPATSDAFEIIASALPPEIERGRPYYVKDISLVGVFLTYTFSATYNGPAVTGAQQWFTDFPGGAFMVIQHQSGKQASTVYGKDKSNPYPPGFNYPNHYTPTAGNYQPFRGISLMPQPKQAHYTGLAVRIHEYAGEPVYVIPFAVGGTSLAQREVISLSGLTGQAWFDPDQQSSWSAGDPSNCYARLLDVLDAAKIAFESQGDTGECIGIVWTQGEEDSTTAARADRYYRNCVALKNQVRAAIRERGLCSISAHKIPWIAPKVRPNVLWVYADVINAAIDRMVDEDPYSRSVQTSDLPMMLDGIHYSGTGMNTLGQRIYEQWMSVQRMGSSEVDICNLALANIGETAKITSIDPPDGSAQASLCARFYPIARDSLIEMGSWSFSIKRKSLTATTNTRTEWAYAYTVPSDASGILSLTMEGVLDDLAMNGVWSPQKFVIELLPSGDRILYTNVEDAQIRYIAKITDTTLFTNTFNVALSWHLASMLAGPLIKGDVGAAEAKRCAQMATAWMMRAATHDTTTQAEIKPMHTPSWIGNR
jgi:hypothetical protein